MIKSRIKCDNYWKEFLPLDKDDWISYDMRYDDKIYNVEIGIESFEKDTDSLNRPNSSKKLKRKIFQGKHLTIILSTDCERKYLEALANLDKPISPNDPNATSEELLINEIYIEVKKVLFDIVNCLIDNLRNQFQQYWIKSSVVLESEFLDHLYWKTPVDLEWKNVLVLNFKTSIMSLNNNIGLNEWNDLGERLKNRKKSEFIYFLLSSARREFSNKKMRMAIIEAIIALEHLLGNYTSNLLSTQFVLNEEATNTIFEKLGLRRSASIIFENMPEFRMIEEKYKVSIIKGIEIRNSVMHQKGRKIKSVDVYNLLEALEELIRITFQGNGNSNFKI